MAFDFVFDDVAKPLLLDAKVVNQPDVAESPEEKKALKKVVYDTFKVLNLLPIDKSDVLKQPVA